MTLDRLHPCTLAYPVVQEDSSFPILFSLILFTLLPPFSFLLDLAAKAIQNPFLCWLAEQLHEIVSYTGLSESFLLLQFNLLCHYYILQYF